MLISTLILALTMSVQPATFGLFQPQSSDTSYATINAAFTPDGQTVYFSKAGQGWAGLTIFVAHRRGNAWSQPEVAPFSGTFRDTDPAVTPDGAAVIFASMRPPAGHENVYGLYIAYLRGDKAGTVEPLPPAINDVVNPVYPTIARDGTLYFVAPSEKSRARIYRAPFVHGAYQPAHPMELPGDVPTVFDIDPAIAPDQRFIAFSSNRPDSLGSNDLYVSFRSGDHWCAPMHLDAPINSSGAEIATGLSPDGRTLYFASTRNGNMQPRSQRVDVAGFQAELARYDNGSLHTYSVDLGPWLDAHAHESC